MRSKLLFLTSLALLISLASSTPVAAPAPQQTQGAPGDGLTWELAGDGQGDIVCETDRTSDYYGLGVRMGIYAAWLTSWIANVALPDEIAGSLDTNAIFLFALVIAVVRCTITNLTSRVDGLMLVHLCLGTVFGTNSVWGYRTCVYKNEGHEGIRNFGGFGTHLRLLLNMAVSVYGFWFWMFGVRGSLLTGPAPCDMIWTFFFGRLRVNSGIRTAYLVLFIAMMVYYGIMVLVGFLGPLMRICKMHFLIRYRFFRTSSRLRYATGFTYGQLKILFYVFSSFNLFWIVYTIVSCEYTLQYNHIQSVLGENGRIFFPSQLIPFAVGICGLVRVAYLYFESYRSVDHSPSLGHTPSLPKRTRTIPRGRHVFKLLAPPTKPLDGSANANGNEKTTEIKDSDLDEEMVGRQLWLRLLVSYLPWLMPAMIWCRTRAKVSSPKKEPHPIPGEKLEGSNNRDSDVERGESSDDGRRRTWGTENTLHMNPADGKRQGSKSPEK